MEPEGIHIDADTVADVALATVQRLSRDKVLLEAAVQDLRAEVTRLTALVPKDEEVEADGVASLTTPS